MTRVAAVDYGSRRIGLAVADDETALAFARPAVAARGRRRAAEAVGDLLAREGVTRVVVGLPLLETGREGAQAAESRAFGALLAQRGLEVVYWDERLSSWQARVDLRAAGRRRTRASGEVDSAAARVILQDYLDVQRQPAASPKETE
ncbi:MAG: Holliday junction resolvase RuvX [Candidatus Limnocylindria bacterium]